MDFLVSNGILPRRSRHESDAAPLRVIPRLDAKPWGGTRLADYGFRIETAGDPLGEALVTHGDSWIIEGNGQMSPLAKLAAAAPARMIGERGEAATGTSDRFPLLVKLIDGMDDLSVQVHPDDALARAQGEPTGKTEAWYVLAAEPGAMLYLGFADGVEPDAFFAAARSGDPGVAEMLRRVPAEPGMAVVLPAGVMHAIGRGVLVYEIQQPSNTTFRLYDWNRTDRSGRPRELHHAIGEQATKPDLRPEPVEPVTTEVGSVCRQFLLATGSFALERVAMQPWASLDLAPVASPQVLTCVDGLAVVIAGGSTRTLRKGESVILPVDARCELTSAEQAVVLRGWVPDLAQDVVAPSRLAGVADDAIAGLSGELTDMRAALG